MVAVNLSMVANENLLLDKVCRVNLGYSNELCDTLMQRNLSSNASQECERNYRLESADN